MAIAPPNSNEGIAFARYIDWLYARDPFTGPEPAVLGITASLPELNKQASLWAIRTVGESGRGEYGIIELHGDLIVFERVISLYFAAQRQAEGLPLPSVLITPRNYRFRYGGAVETADGAAYIFRITPKKSHSGLIRGELWIDPLTGAPILVTGRTEKNPSRSKRDVGILCQIIFVDGQPFALRTKFRIETRQAGSAELTIIESPLLGDRESAGDPTGTSSAGGLTLRPRIQQ